MLAVMLAPRAWLALIVSGASLVCLAALGALAARVGGASAWIGAARVAFWGALAMAATAGVGALFGTTVS
jgi:VIT1/CCC1 family predicted Fe2+/Mn2+ transporter